MTILSSNAPVPPAEATFAVAVDLTPGASAQLWSALGGAVGLRRVLVNTARAEAQSDKALTLGVNWTLNRFVKVQVNGIREHVEDPERNPVPNGAAFWSRVIRLQFVL